MIQTAAARRRLPAVLSACLTLALLPLVTSSSAVTQSGAEQTLARRVDRAEGEASKLANFAGVYLDGDTGTRPTFLFTGNLKAADVVLREFLAEDEYDVRTVDRSAGELLSTQDAVWGGRAELDRVGVHVVATGIHYTTNQVRVGVVELTDAKSAELIERYGDAVLPYDQGLITYDTCNIEACWQPSGSDVGMKGGLQMNQGSASPYCTGGFLGTRANGDYVILTAGHCIALGNGQVFKHNGYTIGSQGSVHTWYDGSNADVGLVTLNATPDNLNRYLQNDGGSGLASVSAVGTGQLNERVCRIGAGAKAQSFPAKSCGKIVDVLGNNESCNPSGTVCKTIHLTATVNFDSCPGDSGGAVFQDPADYSPPDAMGTHVSSDAGCHPTSSGYQGWYSPLGKSIQELIDHEGVTVTINTQP